VGFHGRECSGAKVQSEIDLRRIKKKEENKFENSKKKIRGFCGYREQRTEKLLYQSQKVQEL
jgi:hypothetical protein